ncbi:DUF4097 family beta strand repeat-containing protein [Nonomuraea soli]|uniref:DUF4097 domain-containing protein n=1 Tax=Nonomuraea soli TaxID=1032476 RepID=A0A7W0CJA1_9ACTN|nr:DUF4097 family beta strand repeat-containing protein [Nonomuraea soli]MBA2892186.1 hypothetical protein [Nonomuraea soli]
MTSRKTWVAWGAVATAIALAAGVFVGWVLLERPPSQEVTAQQTYPLTAADLALNAVRGPGEVQVFAGRPGEVRVERKVRWDRAEPRVVQTYEGGELRLELECPRSTHLTGSLCEADYRVWVPPKTRLRADVGDGLLAVTGIHGALQLTAADGTVMVSDASGALTLRTRSGSVVAAGLRSPEVDVQSLVGDVTLDFAGVPEKVSAILTEGTIALDVPDEGRYRVVSDVTRGGETVDVATSEAATSVITARVTEGSLRIR